MKMVLLVICVWCAASASFADEVQISIESGLFFFVTPETGGGNLVYKSRLVDSNGDPVIANRAKTAIMSANGYYYIGCDPDIHFFNAVSGPDQNGWFVNQVPIGPGSVNEALFAERSMYLVAQVYPTGGLAHHDNSIYLDYDIRVVSPDIDGDGIVGADDIDNISYRYNYDPDWHIDLNLDGCINLSDLLKASLHTGDECQ